jgi:hypothetical protein
MIKSIRTLSVSLIVALAFTTTASAQYASDNIRNYSKQKMQQLPADQRNVHHNTLTASNKNLLPSNRISKINPQDIPANMRSNRRVDPNNIPANKPRVLASNSPKLKQKRYPKRPPALPVVF